MPARLSILKLKRIDFSRYFPQRLAEVTRRFAEGITTQAEAR